MWSGAFTLGVGGDGIGGISPTRPKPCSIRFWPIVMLSLGLLLPNVSQAQLLIPGAAIHPSPGSTQVILPSQCVIATPTAGNSVILTPCPAGVTISPPPAAAQLPAPVHPAPSPPVAETKPAEDTRPPIIINILPAPPPTVSEQPVPPPAPRVVAPQAKKPEKEKPCKCP